MVVGDEDLLELDQADVAPQKLTLRSLGAIEEQPFAAPANEGRGEGAPGSRCGPGRAEEDHVEIHAGGVYALKSALITADTSGMASRAYRSAGLLRSLALLWTFLLASGLILAAGAFVLSSVLTQNFREQILADSSRDIAVYVRRGSRTRTRQGRARRIERPRAAACCTCCGFDDELLKVSVWSRKGRHVFTTPPGKRPIRTPDVLRALRSRQAQARVTEIAAPGRGGRRSKRAVVVSAPLASRSGRPVGVAQVSLDPTALDTSIASATRTVWMVVGIVFAILWLALVAPREGGRLAALAPERLRDGQQARSQRVLAASGAEPPRDDRDPECRGRSSRPVHGRSLTARPSRRARNRS